MRQRFSFHVSLNYNLKELYWIIALRATVFSLIGIYIPVFLIKKGLTYRELALYYIFLESIQILLFYYSAKALKKVSAKNLLMTYLPFLIIHFILLRTSKQLNLTYLTTIAITYAFSMALFWLPFKVLLSEYLDNKNSGKEIGIIKIINLLIQLVNPLIGAIIITKLNFSYLFSISIIILLFSIYPLLKIQSKSTYKLDTKFVKRNFFEKDSVVYFVEGFTTYAEAVIWPLFIFYILNNYLGLGLLQSIFNAIILLATIYVSVLADKTSKHKLIKYGCYGYSFSWLLRELARFPIHLFLTGAFGNLTYTLLSIPYVAKFYEKAKHKKIETILIRELWINFGRLTLMICFYIMLQKSILFGFVGVFLITALLTFFYSLF